jgi:DNA-binding transcriptional LysR family regulator
MDRLTAMEAFVRVVERGGFSAAAEDMRMSRAMVSRHVQELEQHLGARLLNRTTRKIGLTEAGQVYYERSTHLLADVADAEGAVNELHARPRGQLRVNGPVVFGTLHLASAVADYMAAFPEVSVELTLNDRVVDLVEEAYDLAIRIGRLGDSSLIARRLAPCRIVVCAAPDYLARMGTPRKPSDLTAHDCMRYMHGEGGEIWHFDGPEGKVAVRVHGQFRTNNGEAMRVAAVRGRAIAALPSFIISAELASGALVPLLTEWHGEEMAVHAVYPPGRNPSPKLRSFIDFLVPRFGEHPSWDGWMTRTKEVDPVDTDAAATDGRVAAPAS